MYVFIDGSYFVFYRFHAVLAWWKLRHPETYDVVAAAPIDNPEFVAQFQKLTAASIADIGRCCAKVATATATVNPRVMIAKDCPRKEIWRMALYPEYKGTRAHCSTIAPFFELFYRQQTTTTILSQPTLEADDCIALACKAVRQYKQSNAPIFIIASDNDYLQLLQLGNVYITDLRHMTSSMMALKRAFTDLEAKQMIRAGPSQDQEGQGKYELLKKILLGDKSDNIPAVLDSATLRKLCKKAGCKKTDDLITYFVNNSNNLIADLTECDKMAAYTLNQQLISFGAIPGSDCLLGYYINII